LAIKKHIFFVIIYITIFSTFSYGQSSLGTVCAESNHYYGVNGYEGSSFAWAVESGGIILNGDGQDTIEIRWGYDVGTYQMEVVEFTESGCMGVPVMSTVTIQAPLVNLGFDFYEICDGDSATFDASGDYDGIPSYLWHDGSVTTTYTADTTENIWVQVTDGLGCVRYDSIEFIAHSLPVVDLGQDTIHCDAANPLIIDAGDFYGYEWQTNDDEFIGNPIYLETSGILFADTVKVLVTDVNGCQDIDTMLVLACDVTQLFADMINVFTPGGSDKNDTWNVLKDGMMDQFPDAVLEVFDRWGRLVYRTENVAEEPWDGTSKGRKMPMDAYFFVLELNFANFEPITGTVNLIR